MHRFSQWIAYALLAYFAYLLLRITVQYAAYPLPTDVGFLRIKQDYVGNELWLAAFFIHVLSSMFALAAGFTQFSTRLRRRIPRLHRAIGYAYLLNVLFVTGPAAFIMALYANGGWVSRVAFTLLAVLWLGTTAAAWYFATQRNWALHRDFMVRSYALTLSAIALRLWKVVLVWAFQPNPMDVYRIVAWLGFVPNLLLAEWIIWQYYSAQRGAQVQTGD